MNVRLVKILASSVEVSRDTPPLEQDKRRCRIGPHPGYRVRDKHGSLGNSGQLARSSHP